MEIDEFVVDYSIDMTAKQVIEGYTLRWSIESIFNQLKLSWGMNDAR
jgi:hypothetical protein